MTCRLFTIGILIFVDACLSGSAAGRPPAPSEGARYAFLVGVQDYDERALRGAPFAENDMSVLGALLTKAGYRQVMTMTASAGTKDEGLRPVADRIRKQLRDMLEARRRTDTVLVAFAGQTVELPDSAEKYFCPLDAKLADKTTLIPLAEISLELSKCVAGTKLLLVDGDRMEAVKKLETVPRDAAAAVKRSDSKPVAADRPVVPANQSRLKPGKAAAIFSCAEGQSALDHPEGKHSVFFHFLLQGLRGDADRNRNGQIEFSEIGDFTQNRVAGFARSELDQKQTPQVIGESREPLVSLAASSTGTSRGTKLALLVGVGNYDQSQLGACPSAEHDLDELAEVLGKAGYRPEDILVLNQTRGTKDRQLMPGAAQIRKELRNLLRGRLRDDVVLVAFAGQGVHYQNTPDSFFCPADTRLSDPSTLISLNEVYADLDRCHAGAKFLLVNAGRRDPRQSATSAKPASVRALTVASGSAFASATVLSSSAGKRAYDAPDLQHSAFYYVVIEGLKGEADLNKDGKIVPEELQRHVRARVPPLVRSLHAADQHPSVEGPSGGPLPLITLSIQTKRKRGLVDE